MKRNSIDVLKNDAIIFGKIISEFRRPVSIYTMAKKLFSEDVRKSEAFLRWWFDKWKEEGVVKEETINGVKNYTIDFKKVKWGDAKLKIMGEEISLGFVMAIKTRKSWVVISI
ncbi:MAG: hypothetical protein OH338_04850 [Candidatus Parvarchaeota archaeon]|nr:hypothetical protein [Candidatus Parvarchaeum tengchongense]